MRPEHAPLPALRRALAVLGCSVLCAAAVAAQQPATGPAPDTAATWAPRSGDAMLDRRLVDINAYAARYPQAFVDELVRYFDAPRALVVERMAAQRTMPADLYQACAIARVTGRPCRSVLEARERAPEEHWASLATRLGVAPGSPQAARVQQAFVDSYRRWSRPLPDAPAQPPDTDRKRK